MSLEETELDINACINNIFNTSPMPPFSFRLGITPGTVKEQNNFLELFVMTGCEKLFNNTQLHNLSEKQIILLREYLLSIGYDADYNTLKEKKIVKVYTIKGIPYLRSLENSRLNITFKIGNPSLNKYNSHNMPLT